MPSSENMKKAAQHRENARRMNERRLESQERCDTDGFLSQWASGLSSQLELRHAEIAEADGMGEFVGLYEGERRVLALEFEDNYGNVQWRLHESETELISKRGKPYIPYSWNGNSRIQKKLGLSQAPEMAPAQAFMTGSGTGLSGNCWVSQRRTGDRWGSDAVKCES